MLCLIHVSVRFGNFWKIDDEDHENLHRIHTGCILPAKFHATFILFPADLPMCSSALPADYGFCMRLGFDPNDCV